MGNTLKGSHRDKLHAGQPNEPATTPIATFDTFLKSDDFGGYLADLLAEAPRVFLLVTGRQTVGLDCEQEVRLDRGMKPAQAEDLFLARVRLRIPNWSPTADENPDLAGVLEQTKCWRLAFEFAEAPVKSLARRFVPKRQHK